MEKKSILFEIVEYKKSVVDTLYRTVGLDSLKSMSSKVKQSRISFFDSIKKEPLSLIAEIKKASPSKGIINSAFFPDQLALDYVHFGASALSVLTDEKYFQGSNDILSLVRQTVDIPILRKDFILDPIQVYESKAIQADAILIILAILSVDQAQRLIDMAYELHLDVLIEIHNEDDVEKLYALKGVKIIGINNRDLMTFSVDINRANYFQKTLKSDFSECLFVAESGYNQATQCEQLNDSNFDAVLIGEGLVISESLRSFFYES